MGCSSPVSIHWIASRQRISPSYLEQILARLRRKKIVKSFKGPGGGYCLAKSPEEITLWDVYCALEDRCKLLRCLADGRASCRRAGECVTRLFWQMLQERIDSFLRGTTLAQLLEQDEKLRSAGQARRRGRRK